MHESNAMPLAIMTSGVVMGVALAMVVQAEPPFGLSFSVCRKLLLSYPQMGTRPCVALTDDDGGSQPKTKQTHTEAELRELQGQS